MKRKYKIRVGRHGEDFAVTLLEEMGMIILKRNYRCRGGEIDIIARRGYDIHFIEVKTRVGNSCGTALEAVQPGDLESKRRVAELYIERVGAYNYNVQFDVLAIQIDYVENVG